MKMLIAFLIILLGLFLFLTRDYNSYPKEDNSTVYHKPKHPTSKVQLDIKLNTQKLSQELSAKLPMDYQLNSEDIEKFNNDDSKKHKWINVNISRLGTPQITVEDKLLALKLDAKIFGKLSYEKCTKIPFYDDLYCINTDTDFSMIVSLSTKIDIDVTPEWNLKVKDISQLDIKVQKASASIYGVDIPITFVINHIIKKHSKELIPTIKDNIEKISIKKDMQDVWNKMHLKKKIPNEDIWFHFIPKDIAFSKSYHDNNTLILHPKITGEAKIVTNSEHNSTYQKLSLPNLKKSDPNDSNFSIRLPIELDYDELSQIMIQKIGNKHIDTKGFKIFINNIRLYVIGEKLYIEVHFHTDFKFNLLNTEGVITLTGKPNYDIKTQYLNIEELEYSLDTQKSLVSIGSLLWYDYFKNELEKLLKYDISKTDTIIKKYKHIINQKVTDIKLHDDIELNGDVNRLSVDNIYLDKSNIVIILNIAGDLNMTYLPETIE